MVAYRYIRISRQSEAIELQSSDASTFSQLVGALSESASGVRLSLSEPPDRYFQHCHVYGPDEHVERAWKWIAERLCADGWVRLDGSSTTSPSVNGLMYFGIPPAEYKPA
jgi:hypothetical protein